MDPSGFLVPATTTELLHIPNEAVNLPTLPTTTTTTTTHVPNHNHPPYAEMITDAITALKDRNGSSRQAIAKYIERVYKDQLPQTHSALLTHHLKRLKNNGHLLMFKHSYKLPRSDSSPPSPPPPPPPASSGPNDTARKRGRPPKPKTPNQPNNMPMPVPVPAAAVVVDGPPPPLLTTTTTMVSKRKPGRPARVVSGMMGLDGIKKKNPGRPRKTKLVSGVMGPERIKRGPGRPAKNQTKPLMIPYLTDDVPPRPRRGRPKRDGSSRANAPPVNATAASNGVGIVSARRRGRPAKVSGTKKSVRGIGKPAGRPRKNNALARVPSAGTPMWMVDYGYVKSKLDNVQSRIQQAVSLLKPHLLNVNAVTVAAGLQELEEISTMDVIGAPSHVAEVQEPVPPPLNFEGQEPVLQNQEPHLEQLGV